MPKKKSNTKTKKDNKKKTPKVTSVVFCKKLKLKPVPVLDNKKWAKRVLAYFAYHINYQSELIEKYELWMQDATKTKKEAYKKQQGIAEKKIEKLKADAKRFENLFTNGLETQNDEDFIIKIAKDYTYDFIRKACKSEAQRKNAALSFTFSECLNRNIKDIEDIKERSRAISDILNFCNRVKSKSVSEQPNSLADMIDIENPLGGYGYDYKQAIRSNMLDMIKDGLLEGKIALKCYRMDGPVTIGADHFSITPDFDLIGTKDYTDLQRIIKKENGRLYVNIGGLGNPTIAQFEIILGSKQKARDDLFSLFYDILKKNCTFGGSSVQITDRHEIILNLTIKKDKELKNKLKDDIIVGVDVGINTPAMCALNKKKDFYLALGSKDDFLRMRGQLKAQRKRLDCARRLCTTAEEKKRLLTKSERLTKHTDKWAQTYNHMISKRIITFALRNNAGIIRLENLSKFSDEQKQNNLLEDWSYFQLQNYIEYKAKAEGIKVEYVNPENTSTTCACCGETENTERRKNSIFICHNPKCKNCDKEVNADLNAAKNIASTEP